MAVVEGSRENMPSQHQPSNTPSIPKGFKISHDANGNVQIEYASTGVQGLVGFLIVAVGGLTFGCAHSAYEVYHKYGDLRSFMDALRGLPLWGWGVLGFMAFFPLAFGLILMWFLFGRTRFTLSEQGLWVHKQLFFWQRIRFVPVEAMRYVQQEKDGGQEMTEDSFATWRLRIKTSEDIELLWKQPIDKSDWLGKVLAEKYSIPFIQAEERE